MASTLDVLRSGISAVGAGKEVTSDNVSHLDTSTPGESHSSASPTSDEESPRAENSVLDDLLSGDENSGDTPPASSGKESKADSKPNQKTSVDKEVITVTDETGKKRKIEIDYANRESIKKMYSMAHGARKWQAERDQALQSSKKIQGDLEQRNKDWGVLEQAYQQGPDALFDLLQGRKGAFQEYIQAQIQRSKFLENASPAEIKQLETREQADRQSRELEKIRKENEEFRKSVTQEREQADMRSLESRVNPVFDKYRFADKLGNPDDEHMFDEMLWNSALKRLEPYEEQGLDITQELLDKEFRAVASAIRRRIGVQAEKTASKTIERKKQEATENVQSRVMSGYRGNETAQEARGLINSGNLTGLLKNWGKYGSLFGGGGRGQ